MESELQSTLALLDPSYSCRYRARYHAKTEEIMNAVQDYFAQRWPWPSEHVKQYYMRAKLEEATCISFPTVLDDRIEAVVLGITYSFLLDDILESLEHEKVTELVNRLSSIILGEIKPDPKDQVGFMAADIYNRLLSDDSEDGQKMGMELMTEVCSWMQLVADAEGKLESMKNLDSYMEWRYRDVAARYFIHSGIWGSGIYMPRQMSEDLDVIQLIKLTGYHVTLGNDLFSYRAEALRPAQRNMSGEYFIYNAVVVISAEKEVDTQTAMNEVKQRLFQMEDEFELLVEKLQKRYVDVEGILVKKLVQACKDLMAGNCEWSTVCYRYNEALGL